MAGRDASRKQIAFLVRYCLQAFAAVLFVAIMLRTFLLASYSVNGTAMLPNILPGDFLIGKRWSVKNLHRGQVVSMRCPGIDEQLCLKRVIALPGERVEFQAGRLIVNGAPARYQPLGGDFQTEIVGHESWAIWPAPDNADQPPLVVPPHEVYLLNDKREDVSDSRSWGTVPSNLVEARAWRIWLALDWREGGDIRSWPRIRWERIFRSID